MMPNVSIGYKSAAKIRACSIEIRLRSPNLPIESVTHHPFLDFSLFLATNAMSVFAWMLRNFHFPQVVLLPRNKTDGNKENHAKLLQAVKKGRTGNEGPSILGSLLKEEFDG